MKFTDWLCPFCKRTVRRWEWESGVSVCTTQSCKEAQNLWTELPGSATILADVKMERVAEGSVSPKFTITRDL